MRIQIQVDAEEFWPSLERDIGRAQDTVYIQTLSFEGDSVGLELSRALMESRAADRRVIADDFYTRYKINDKFFLRPRHFVDKELRRERRASFAMIAELEANGVPVKLTNPSGPLMTRAFARNHKKIIVVDDRIAYIGGINFSEHNFEWHDMMLRIEDADVAGFLKEDFLSGWRDHHVNTSRRFPGLEIYRFDGKTNAKTFEPILELMGQARESIYVECPYMSFPFYEKLGQAARNGAAVTLVTPAEDNWGLFKDYGLWEAARAGIDARFYVNRVTHLKAMLIDDRYLIVGSANFYFMSFFFMQEIAAVITDEDAISQFKTKVIAVDLERAERHNGKISNFKGHLSNFRLRALAGLFSVLGRIPRTGR